MTPISIVYEEADFVVINKPSGLLTHAKNTHDTDDSVAQWALEHHPQIAEVNDEYIEDEEEERDTARGPARHGIVHRLDRETSGLLIIAKTQIGFRYLKKLFQDRTIQKTYIALVYGTLKQEGGTIDAPLAKLGLRQTTQIHGTHELKPKTALTHYRVIAHYPDYTLLEVKPKTGRTHQIRVHLKSLGRPIVCDRLYAEKSRICPPELGRLFLHAQRLELTSPSGQRLVLEAELPPELQSFLDQLADLAKKEDLG